MRRYTNLLAVLALSTGMALHAQTNELVIQTKKLGAEIQPTMYGLFFEDINYAADGGLICRTGKEPFIRVPPAPDGMEYLWQSNIDGRRTF